VHITRQCNGAAVRAESESNVTGGNPVIVDVMRQGHRLANGT